MVHSEKTVTNSLIFLLLLYSILYCGNIDSDQKKKTRKKEKNENEQEKNVSVVNDDIFFSEYTKRMPNIFYLSSGLIPTETSSVQKNLFDSKRKKLRIYCNLFST